MDLHKTIEVFLGDKIISSSSVSGGCIANSRIISTQKGNRYFLKTKSGFRDGFEKEANGLKELAKANAVKLPGVLLAGDSFLLLEYIETGHKGSNFFSLFGSQFAKMHQFNGKHFGFYQDNYIGSNPQYNIPTGNEKTNWPDFYFNKRLLPQFKMAEKYGNSTPELASLIAKTELKLPSILDGSQEAPCILHGDLWGGNYLCNSNQQPVLIDPAVYYGHREADLAMTKMFGGFTSEFYRAYNNTYPLKEGWEYREGIYLLYHYLNHLNLFGASYYGSCVSLLQKYVS